MEEIWKDIVGFEGLYQVSNLGRVRTLFRVITRANNRPHTIKQRILKPAKDTGGYLRVALSKDGKLYTKKVHRLVAEAFCLFEVLLEVDHIDGDKTNNKSDNLEWVTRSENVQRAFDSGLAKPLRGGSNPRAKIDEMQALTIITLIENGRTLKKIHQEYGVSYHIVKDINRGKTWNFLRH